MIHCGAHCSIIISAQKTIFFCPDTEGQNKKNYTYSLFVSFAEQADTKITIISFKKDILRICYCTRTICNDIVNE
jgi:hypothetical protein